MSLHIAGAIVTHHAPAANNRGETEGNVTTLQKLMWKGNVHTTVSAEAIRWAVRYDWQRRGLNVRRKWDEAREDYDETQDFDESKYIDDDLMGYMLAEGAKSEGNSAENKGKTTKRRGVLEVSRAVSLDAYAGDVTFNARAGEKGSTSLYGTELHATRYQYGFVLTPERLEDPTRTLHALRAIISLGEVAGNHSRFLYDFSPESIVLRLSEDPSPRILYCFEDDGEGGVTAEKLLRAVDSGDVPAEELVIGGLLAYTEAGETLKTKGASVFKGVREAGDKFHDCVKEKLS